MITRIVICCLLLCSVLSGGVRPITTIEELKSETTSETLVLLDIDDTILRSSVSLGWGEWWIVLRETYTNAGISKQTAFPILGPSIGWIFQNVPMEPMEKNTAEVVSFLQQKGINVLGLTARSKSASYHPYFHLLTREHLRSVGVDFTSSVLPEGLIYDEESGIGWDFFAGVVFTNQALKGPVLAEFLKAHNLHPKRIVLVDDRLDQLTSVDASMQELGIPFVGLHYQRPSRPFSLAAANIQWHMLITTGHIPSDEEALEIQAMHPERPENFFVDYMAEHLSALDAFLQ